MRIAFYAPMKPPTHEVPSGDRRMARLLMSALSYVGHDVYLASEFRSWDNGEPARQRVIKAQGEQLAKDMLRTLQALPAAQRPQVWFTYHLYHKAPDWLGPIICRGLNIPYIVIEASHAPKQAGGKWDIGYHGAKDAIAMASAIVSLNPIDTPCLKPIISADCVLSEIKAFIDLKPYVGAPKIRDILAKRWALDPDVPWLLCVAMMRNDVKYQSYQLLAQALTQIQDLEWQLLIVGDGPARPEVEHLFAPMWKRVRLLGERDPADLPSLYASCDLYAWPALNEAFGLSFIEAQAAALPVLAGDSGGVSSVVEQTLVPANDVTAFVEGLRTLLGKRSALPVMGEKACLRMINDHGLEAAAQQLNSIVHKVIR